MKTLKLTGTALEAALKVDSIKREAMEAIEALQEEYRQKADELNSRCKLEFDHYWGLLAACLNMTLEELEQYRLDVSYQEHGDIYLYEHTHSQRPGPSDTLQPILNLQRH